MHPRSQDINPAGACGPQQDHAHRQAGRLGRLTIRLHRCAHALWQREWRFLARLLSQVTRWLTGTEIHPGAHIGRQFTITHGMGIVIGETAVVGDRVTLSHGVTLGGTGKARGKRHPTIMNNVTIGIDARILGAITIGDGAVIASGAVVIADVPPHSMVAGIPASVILRDLHRRSDVPDDACMAQAHTHLRQQLATHILDLTQRVARLEHQTVTPTQEIDHAAASVEA
ncbi:MAG TPA: serine O-acetyltransferase EpsC [Herpetosiphonaceae bacterium]